MNRKILRSVVIDAGHGGSDPGASSNGIVEKDYTLKISEYINGRLNELGINSSLSRDSDISLNPEQRVKKIQDFYGNGSDVIVISNHLNAGGGDGAEIIYSLRNNNELSKKIAKELEIVGQNVRKYYQRRLPSNPSKDYYFIHRLTPDNESIIVEYGFVDSKGNDPDLIKNDWEILAEAVVKAVADYIGADYIAPNESNYYTVKSGDTLWSIAKKYNISVEQLKKINNLSSNLLSVGQSILINEDDNIPTKETTYIVKKGDTLYSIASKFNISVIKLKEINNLKSNIISVGQELIVNESNNTNNNKIYPVKKGDTLWSIANNYKINVDELKSFNNLETDSLSIGQIIYIPNKKEYNVYVVKQGDNLYKIARENNTTVSEIVDLNNLESSNLDVNQKLLLP